MLYDGWMSELACRADKRFSEIVATHNFDLGPEFEIALASFLREWLPSRVGVCRGFVIDAAGRKAGDDVIVFDRSRFPTLRGLGDDLSRKETVPFEAVLAYIEAKHTLQIEGAGGQSLDRAVGQIRAVRALKREPVALNQVGPNLRFDGPAVKHFIDGDGFPSFKNPLYAAIFARNVNPDSGAGDRIGERLVEIGGEAAQLPDAIAAGNAFAVAAVEVSDGLAVRPSILGSRTTLAFANLKSSAFGVGAAHLLWAVERIELGKLRWADMIHEVMRESGKVSHLKLAD